MTKFDLSHCQRWLDDLQSLIARRSEAEQQFTHVENPDEEFDVYEAEKALRAQGQAIYDEQIARKEAFDANLGEIENRHRTEVAAAEQQYALTVEEIQQQAARDLADVQKTYEESCWIVSSVLDDESEANPKYRYEQLKNQLGEVRDQLNVHWDELKALFDRTVALLEQRHQSTDGETTSKVTARDRKEAVEGFHNASEVVTRRFGNLQRQRLPRLFGGFTYLLIALLAWVGLFAAAYFLVDPAWLRLGNVKPTEFVVLCGAAAFGVVALVLMVLWGIARWQTGRQYRPLQQAMLDAQAYHGHWQRLAKDELLEAKKDYRRRYAAIADKREQSLVRFAKERDERIAAINTRRAADLQPPAHERQTELQRSHSTFEAQRTELEETYQAQHAALSAEWERLQAEFHRNHAERLNAEMARRQQMWNALVTDWRQGIEDLGDRADEMREAVAGQFPTWDTLTDPAWNPAEQIPAGLPLGRYDIDLANLPDGLPATPELQTLTDRTQFSLPCVLPFPRNPSLLLRAADAGRPVAVSALQSTMLRLLTELPPGKVRFTIIDPVGLGENFSAFMHLADYDDLLITSRIWTESQQIDEQLAKITEHMESVFQKYLRNEFESLEDYNVHAGEVAEPYRILVVANYPVGFSDRAAQRLASIATSGPRCGVYTLISLDEKQPLPRGADATDLQTAASVFTWRNDRFESAALKPVSLPVSLEPPPAAKAFGTIVRRMGEASKDVRRVEVPFRRIAPRDEQRWTGDSRRSIEVAVGRAGATKLQKLRLGIGTSQHALIAGKTGSGKSTLLHVLITNLALNYSPQEVQFYLIDFKKGVEFKAYATLDLPHARVIAVESDREFGVSVLERLDAVLKERGDLFRAAGVQDVEAFRSARPGVPMPRLLFIVDEFQEFFTEDDRLAQTAGLLLDRLVRQGRAFGIHVLLGSQTLGGAYSLARTTIGQMAIRIALQCSEADAHLILSEDNTAARLLTRPGEAIYNDANGLLEGNSPFQVSWLSDEERDGYLSNMSALAKEQGMHLPPAIVFEGNIPADPSRNTELVQAIEQRSAAGDSDEITFAVIGGDGGLASDGEEEGQTADATPRAWVGDAVAITGPTEVRLRPQAGANLLLVGQDLQASRGILAASLVSLSVQFADRADLREDGSSELPQFFLFTSEPATATGDESWQSLIDVLPREVRRVSPAEAPNALTELAAELNRRTSSTDPSPPVFLLFDDISRFRELRKAEDDFGFGGFDRDKPPSPGKLLGELLKEGPAVGMHLLIACDSYNNVDRWFGRQLLREFEQRIVFQMSAADSSNLIDTPAASRLGQHRALLYSDERGGTEKFRPYAPPSAAWKTWLRSKLRPEPSGSELQEATDINLWTIQ